MAIELFEEWTSKPYAGDRMTPEICLGSLIIEDLNLRFPYMATEVYCGPYSTGSEAQETAEKLLLVGYNAAAHVDSSGQTYEVFIEGFTDQSAATNLLDKLRAAGFSAEMVGLGSRGWTGVESLLSPEA
jgi:hypothetical protein